MKFRQSLLNYALKHGVCKASRKYNKARSYIYFWLKRYDGSIQSLSCLSRKPHYHPKQHSDEEINLIKAMRKRNPQLGLIEFWCRLRKRGYSRRPESLFRVMKKLSLLKALKPKNKYIPKPYEKMLYPGQRIQIDVKVVPRRCIADHLTKLYQYTAIDEFSRIRFLGAYDEKSTFTSHDFLKKVVKYFKHRGINVECVQTDNGFEFTNRFSKSSKDLLTLFEKTAAKLNIKHKLIRPYTPRHNGKVERSHRQDQQCFYSNHSFYSLSDFSTQLVKHQQRSNNKPMRPLNWLSPNEKFRSFIF